MKRIIIAAIALLLPLAVWGQMKTSDYQFTTIKANPVTKVKNQDETGTCWCHATTAMLESEIIRINNITDPAKYPDLSEWFTVYKAYMDRAVKYIRLNGYMRSGPGSLGGDLLHVVKDYGMVPESAMPCLTKLPDHRQMDKDLKAYFESIVKDKKLLQTDWKAGVEKILKGTLGECPKTFVVDGVTYTPTSYRDAMGIDPENYVTLTSFTHFPFYEAAIVDVPDNWRWDSAYNLPLDELVEVVYSAINRGYTIAWGMDLSNEPGYTKEGLAVLPPDFGPVTQESRQHDYEIQLTVDDHLMQLYGTAVDQNGKPFFMIKDSQGKFGAYDGHRYASEDYFRAKTIYMTVNKAAIPAHILKKLGL